MDAATETVVTVLAVFSVLGGLAAFVHYMARFALAIFDGIGGLVSAYRRRFKPRPMADKGVSPRDLAL